MSEFDPNDATVKQVEEHLEGASAEEIARVREIEEAGQNRSSIHWPEPLVVEEDSGESKPDAPEEPGVPEEGGGESRPADSRPVWNVETHGKPSPSQRDYYRVIGE